MTNRSEEGRNCEKRCDPKVIYGDMKLQRNYVEVSLKLAEISLLKFVGTVSLSVMKIWLLQLEGEKKLCTLKGDYGDLRATNLTNFDLELKLIYEDHFVNKTRTKIVIS